MNAIGKACSAAVLAVAAVGSAQAQDASVRIQVTATVPVACSSGEALSRSVEGTRVTAVFDARCNTAHQLHVAGVLEERAVVTVNNQPVGLDRALVREAYFENATIVTVDLATEDQAQLVAGNLTIQLAPVA